MADRLTYHRRSCLLLPCMIAAVVVLSLVVLVLVAVLVAVVGDWAAERRHIRRAIDRATRLTTNAPPARP